MMIRTSQPPMHAWSRYLRTCTGFAGVTLVTLALSPAAAASEPSEAVLRETCARASAQRWQGVEAAACDWYLDPCTVCGLATAAPGWCMPADVDPAVRAKRVLALLPDKAGGSLAQRIRAALRQAYPCAADTSGLEQ